MNTSRICQTSVPTGLGRPMFRACGRPITRAVVFGSKVCHYCDEHAAAAERFVQRKGQAAILEIERRIQPG